MPRFVLLLLMVLSAGPSWGDPGPGLNDAVRRLLDEPGESQWRLEELTHEEDRTLGSLLTLEASHAAMPLTATLGFTDGVLARFYLAWRSEEDPTADSVKTMAEAAGRVSKAPEADITAWIDSCQDQLTHEGYAAGSGSFDDWTLIAGSKRGMRSLVLMIHYR